MTNLEKLLIKGIRSFNPNDSNTIEFYSPLTLIVGQNGTGKTTIIECLKYITTGNLPPNSKGGAFVYDTKLAQEIDVKAIIKLSFRNIYNKKLVSTRVLQSSFKRNKYEQKTLENTLFVEDEKGMNQNISNKIGNIDKEISFHLGVSSSILENVIFCHQEDSCWPISEPANVKKKFDDIFSSSKYSKALDALKSTKRDVSSQIKLKYQELEFLYKIKDKRNDIEKRIANGKEELVIKENKIKEYDESYSSCENLIRDLNRDIDKVVHVNNRIKSKVSEMEKHTASVLENPQIEEAKCHDILASTKIEELEAEIFQTTEILLVEEKKQMELENEKRLYEKNKAEVAEINNERSKVKNYLTTLNEETSEIKLFLEKQIETVVDKLRNLKRDVSNEMTTSQENLTTIDKTFIEREVSSFSIEKLRSSYFEDFYEQTRRIFTIFFKKCDLEFEKKKEIIDIKKSEIDDIRQKYICDEKLYLLNKEKIKELKDLNDDPEVDVEKSFEFEIKALEDNNLKCEIEKLESEMLEIQLIYEKGLKNIKESYISDKQRKRIEDIKNKLDNVKQIQLEIQKDDILKKIDEMKNKIKETYQLKNKMNIYKEMFISKALIAKENFKAGCKALNEFVIDENGPEKIINDFFLIVKDKYNEEDLKVKLISGVSEKYTHDILSNLQKNYDVVSYSDLISTFRSLGLLEISFDFLKEINTDTFVEEINKCKKYTSSVGNATEVYKNFLKIGCKKNECPLCTSKLINPEKYKSRLEKVILKIPENLEKNNNKMENIVNLLTQADEFNLRVRKYNSITAELVVSTYKKLKEIEEILVNIKEILLVCKLTQNYEFSDLFVKFEIPDCFGELLEEKDLILLDLEEEYSCVMAKIDLFKELKDLEKNFSVEKDSVNINELENKLKSLRTQICKKREELSLIEDKILQLKMRQKKIEDTKTIRELLKKREEIEENIRIFEEARTENSLRKLEDAYKNKVKAYEKFKDKLYKKKMDIEFKQDNFKSKLEKLREAEENLKIVEEKIKEVSEKYRISSFCNEKYEENRVNFMKNKDKLSSLKDCLRMFIDLNLEAKKHISHYKAIEAIENLKIEINRIETLFVEGLSKNRILEIKNYSKANNLDLMSSFNSILKEKKDIVENKKTRIIANRSMIQGEYNQIRILINQLTKELDVEYKDINDKYNKAYIEHKVLELSVKDLDKCIKSLDKAILDFHSSKIEEINRILKDLWSSSYKGSDIDFIEIKSESLGSKTYSYRISLVKNGVELDMRGRSSAGQRMIASIIIRLALSQTFSTTFNVLALDEPTTNLDKENIESLAHTLLKIIRSSSKDSRFQLIIITHDEDFVQILSREGPEYFYRLKRNEKGDSLIQRHSIY